MGRHRNEAWFATDKGLGVCADFPSDTWVTYTMDPKTHQGKVVVSQKQTTLKTVITEKGIPHNYTLWVEFDSNDVWVGTSKGLGWAQGTGYYHGLQPEKKQNQ